MSYITIIVLILFGFSFTDFILPKNKTLHEQLYKIAFFITFFLFTIKYYYGADVLHYYKVYNRIPESFAEVFELTKGTYSFEVGFLYFIAIIKWLGLSYWWMTAIVSMIYFYAIYKLFELIPSYKILALLILVILDYNLIFATHRQCLAVSFYILMFFAYVNKKYLLMVTYSILVILMHKSGLYVTIPVLLLCAISFRPKRMDFFICFICFILMSIIPLELILNKVLQILPFSPAMRVSIIHHILYNTESLAMLLLYGLLVLIPCLCTIEDSTFKKMSIFLFVGCIFISLFYQSSAILWRFRSYFIPFIIVFIFYAYINFKNDNVELTSFINKSKNILMSSYFYLLVLITLYLYYYSDKSMNLNKHKIYETSTIFDLHNKSENEIKEDRLKRALNYWKEEAKYKEKLKKK